MALAGTRGGDTRGRKSKTHSAVMLPIAPFREWIESLIERERQVYRWTFPGRADSTRYPLSPESRVAAILNIDPARLRKWRNPLMTEIREDAADRALCAEGSLHLGDLWPEYWANNPQEAS